MSSRAVHRLGFVCITAILALVFSAFLISPRVMASKDTRKDDGTLARALYAETITRLVMDETELADELALDLFQFSKLLPPSENFHTALHNGVIPYDPVVFPVWIFNQAETVSIYGVPAYDIALSVDFQTWETRIEDAVTGTLLWKIQPPYGFSMQALVRAIWGDAIFDGTLADSVLREYSPSRLTMRYTLISSRDVADYVNTLLASLHPSASTAGVTRLRSPRRIGGESDDWEITDIEKTASGMELTFTTPTNWVSTNTIDIFSTENLIHYWWDLAGSTNGTNEVTWTDTSTSGTDLRFYRIADGETDTDADGATDAQETLAAHSDPDDSDSFPADISGTITHSNTAQSGTIYIMAVTNQSSWAPVEWRHADLSSPGTYTNSNVATLHSYWFKAFRDWRANGILDPWEATGTYSSVSTSLTGNLTNIDIDLTDPPASIAGFLTYTGRQEGVICVIASTSDDWSTNNQDIISSFSEEYVIENLSQTSYYVKAWIDADADGLLDSDRETHTNWTANPIALSNSVWDIDMTLQDVDADGDGIPDWWEIENFGNTNQAASADYDSDQMPNSYEYAQSFNPTNAADAMDDADNDGYPNVYEYKHESDPWNISDDPDGGGDPEAPTPSVIVVTNGSIQAGLDAATNAYDIVRLDPGTYTGSTNRNLDFPSHPVLLIAKEAATNTIVDCQSSGRAITFSGQSNHTAVVQLTIAAGSELDGGGILISNANPMVSGCIFTNCTATNDGGALFLYASDSRISASSFIANDAGHHGGAVYCMQDSDAVFDGCNMSANTATNDGGGICWDDGSDGIMTACVVSGNRAGDDGGGIACRDKADPVITGCTVNDNLAEDNGGGIYTDSSADPVIRSCGITDNQAWDHGGGFYGRETEASLSECSVMRNTAVDGGGIGFISSTVSIASCTIADNWAHIDGGGIRIKESQPTIRSCIVVRNRAFGNGGGIQAKGASCTASLENCTIVDNRSGLSGGGLSSTESAALSATNSVLWGNAPDQLSGASASYSCVQGGAGGSGIVTNDPQLTADTYRLNTGSSCTNSGTNATWMAVALDIDTEARIGNGIVDIGADELYDTDGDDMSDAWEIECFDTLDRDGTDDADADGLTDADEYTWSSDPGDPDTDGDGMKDGADALLSGSPTTAYAAGLLPLTYSFGDSEGRSESEKYALNIVNITNSSDCVIETNTTFGAPLTGSYDFMCGAEYEITLDHEETDPDYIHYPDPDYDYQIYIGDQGGATGWVFGAGFVISDTDAILGNHWEDHPTSNFYALGKDATLYVLLVDLDVDIDGDGDFSENSDDMAEGVSPGQIIGVNWDDDNTNGTLDYLESAYDTNENDLVEMRIALGPTNLNIGTVVFEITGNTNCINVWTSPYKGGTNLLIGADAATNAANWTVGASGDIATLGDFPYTKLWIEGLTNSTTAGDVGIELRYEDTNGVSRCADTNVWTVINVDLDMDVDDDSDVDADDEAKEENPGAIVFENWDNDDGDAAYTPDKDETSVTGENDLVPIYPKIEPTMTVGTLKLEATAGGTRVKVWTAVTKGSEIPLPVTWNLATSTVPATLFLEGFDESTAANDVELKLSYTNGGSAIRDDTLKITVVRQNLGVAVYRDLNVSWPWTPLGHAGLITGYTGKRTRASLTNEANWATTEMGTSGIHTSDLQTLIATRPPFRGSFSVANLADVRRNNILQNAHDCLTEAIEYLWGNAISWEGSAWDGTIADIHELRCDGLVEVCYELAAIEVWGRNGTHYPIQNSPDEHQNLGMDEPQTELSPIVQRGGVGNSPTKLVADVLFQPQALP